MGEKFNSQDFPGGPVVETCTSTAGGMGLIPGQGTKILHGMWGNQKKKKKIQLPSQVSEALRDMELSSPISHCLSGL